MVAAGAASGCTDVDDARWGDNEIVFGIEQTRGAEGKTSTSVGYEFLDVRSSGWSAYGHVSRDRSCWAEKLDERLGKPRVEGGVATFRGGILPGNGIAVVANRQEDLILDAPAWAHGGEALTFEAHGFAMPEIPPQTLRVPSLDLPIASPAADAEVALAIDGSLELAWEPQGGAPREDVVAAFVSEPADGSRGVELRCFFDRDDGRGKLPRALIERFASLAGVGQGGEVRGKLRIATHRQLTILADGGWIVYVVASAPQREQPFVLKR